MSSEQQSAATPTPATAGAADSIMPTQNKEAEDLLKQTSLLKEQVNEATAERERLRKMEQQLAYYQAKEREEAEIYKKNQEPKFNEYVAGLVTASGKELTELEKKQYYEAFTNPQHKHHAERMYNAHVHTVQLAASKKAKEDEMSAALAAKEAEIKRLSEAIAKSNSAVGGMRASYANAMKLETPAAAAAEENRKEVGVSASRMGLNEIMNAPPSVAELPFLREHGFCTEVGVNASATAAANGQRLMPVSVAAAREHRNLYDPETHEPNFPASARYVSPATFAWYINHSSILSDDVSDMVAINASRTFIEEKRVEN